MNTEYSIAQRQHWMAVLAKSEYTHLQALWSAHEVSLAYTVVREPEFGMAQVRGKFANTGNRFNVGDTTITRAAIMLESGEIGHCYMVGQHKDKALLCAYIDAILQLNTHRVTVMQAVIEPLHHIYTEKRAKKRQEIETSKVDFFTLQRGESR